MVVQRSPHAEKEATICDSAIPGLDGVPFLDLGDGWALAADRNQWILIKEKRWRGKIKWQPVSFVGSEKAVLMRVMKEKGLRVPPDAGDAVNRFFEAEPRRFLKWRVQVEAMRREKSV